MATINGTSGADLLRGTSAADKLFGLGGSDMLLGGAGNDSLYGGDSVDFLDGGAGRDYLDGGESFDTVIAESSTGAIWADLRTGVVSFPGQNQPNETWINIEAVNSGSGADRLIGDSQENMFRGNNGNDTLVGNFGDDILIGGAGTDSIDGGNGDDLMFGGLGNDTMLGGVGSDYFRVGPTSHMDDPYAVTFIDTGKDLIDGGAGNDALRVDGVTSFVEDPWGGGYGFYESAPVVRANLSTGTLRIGDSDNRSTLISIEAIYTGSGDDSINGSAADNDIRPGDGANVVYAGLGNDFILGGSTIEISSSPFSTTELLNGGDGNDRIIGGGCQVKQSAPYDWFTIGTDILAGGAGNDTLEGGDATTIETGGSGPDQFLFSHSGVQDDNYSPGSIYLPSATITDFESGLDKIGFLFAGRPEGLEFVGAVMAADLDIGEVGFHRSGSDIIVEARFSDTDEYAHDVLALTLTGYTGPLSASDFDLS